VFPNANIAGNWVTLQVYVDSKGQNASNVTAHIKPSTIENLHDTVRQMTKLTLPNLKQRMVNPAPIPLGASTVRVNTKLTLWSAHSRNTTSIKNSIARTTPRYAKIKRSQLVHL